MKPLVLVAGILGLVFLVVAIVYAVTPAGSLPGFFPGHATDAASAAGAVKHYKHAIGAIIVALVLFAFAWFQSKPRAAV
jgi:hypothetical protein